jgi:hypothetical protein
MVEGLIGMVRGGIYGQKEDAAVALANLALGDARNPIMDQCVGGAG